MILYLEATCYTSTHHSTVAISLKIRALNTFSNITFDIQPAEGIREWKKSIKTWVCVDNIFLLAESMEWAISTWTFGHFKERNGFYRRGFYYHYICIFISVDLVLDEFRLRMALVSVRRTNHTRGSLLTPLILSILRIKHRFDVQIDMLCI